MKHSCYFTEAGRVYPQELSVGELFLWHHQGCGWIGRLTSNEEEGGMPTSRYEVVRKLPYMVTLQEGLTALNETDA